MRNRDFCHVLSICTSMQMFAKHKFVFFGSPRPIWRFLCPFGPLQTSACASKIQNTGKTQSCRHSLFTKNQASHAPNPVSQAIKRFHWVCFVLLKSNVGCWKRFWSFVVLETKMKEALLRPKMARLHIDADVCKGCICIFLIAQTYLKGFVPIWSFANICMCLRDPKYWENVWEIGIFGTFRAFAYRCRCLQSMNLCFLDPPDPFEDFCIPLVFCKHLHVP